MQGILYLEYRLLSRIEPGNAVCRLVCGSGVGKPVQLLALTMPWSAGAKIPERLASRKLWTLPHLSPEWIQSAKEWRIHEPSSLTTAAYCIEHARVVVMRGKWTEKVHAVLCCCVWARQHVWCEAQEEQSAKLVINLPRWQKPPDTSCRNHMSWRLKEYEANAGNTQVPDIVWSNRLAMVPSVWRICDRKPYAILRIRLRWLRW